MVLPRTPPDVQRHGWGEGRHKNTRGWTIENFNRRSRQLLERRHRAVHVNLRIKCETRPNDIYGLFPPRDSLINGHTNGAGVWKRDSFCRAERSKPARNNDTATAIHRAPGFCCLNAISQFRSCLGYRQLQENVAPTLTIKKKTNS